ncbi:hypothetical protein ABZZ74_15825 [Streptomyces sp. NPDC006476]|uniref:SbtR family transcriptional regulator n=1 Tax=Streptomyces sp. NPDC006476 TaxID=3157175 RepID=UPI0033A3EAEE
MADVVGARYPGAERLMAVCDRTFDTSRRIIERAQRAGALRPDFTGEDLIFVLATTATLARAMSDTAPDAWRRNIAFLLDGLRTEAVHHPLSTGALTQQELYAAMGTLTSET